MAKKTMIVSGLRQIWPWTIILGIAGSIFGLMFGLLIQTMFYEIASSIPAVIRQDAHISLPLCNIFPELKGCDAWVGALTALELLELSVLIGQISGLLVNLVLTAILSIWLTVRSKNESVVPGFLVGLAAGLSSLALALTFRVPVSVYSSIGIFSILILLLLPMSGLAGGRWGRKRLTSRQPVRMVYFLPGPGELPSDCVGEKLSERELEVLALVAEGRKNNEIAQQLYISKATVKTHLQHIYAKLGVKNRTAAVTQALAYGLLIQEETTEP